MTLSRDSSINGYPHYIADQRGDEHGIQFDVVILQHVLHDRDKTVYDIDRIISGAFSSKREMIECLFFFFLP